MRIPGPVYTMTNEFRYVENHAGLPTILRIFVFFMRTSALLVVQNAIIPFMLVTKGTPWFIVPGVAWYVSLVFYGLPSTKWDIFLPLGYRLFHRLLTQ